MPSLKQSNTTTATESTFTLRDQPYTYVHVQLTTAIGSVASQRNQTQLDLDEITLRQHLSSALTQSFGITGSAVGVDILKVDGREAWVRVQSADADLLVASLSQWAGVRGTVGLRVLGRAAWLGGLSMGPTEKGKANLWSLEG